MHVHKVSRFCVQLADFLSSPSQKQVLLQNALIHMMQIPIYQKEGRSSAPACDIATSKHWLHQGKQSWLASLRTC